MSFAISSFVDLCRDTSPEPNFWTPKNLIPLGADTVLVMGGVIAVLILSGVIPTGLPTGVGTLSNTLMWCAGGVTAGIIITDVIMSIPRCHGAEKLDIQPEKPIADTIRETPQVAYEPKAGRLAYKTPCHQILPNLYLGSKQAFIETTGLLSKDVDTSNPHEFKTIITLANLLEMTHDKEWTAQFDGLGTLKGYQIAQKLTDQGITWNFVGEKFGDNALYFYTLVDNCTQTPKLNPDYGNPEEEKDESLKVRNWDGLAAANQKKYEHVPVTEWFKNTFALIDEGIACGNVLVHCAAGQSRSAMLLAAYLINRHDVTAEEAVNFLKSKRMCVDPSKFMTQLKAYEIALKAARTKS